MRHIKTRKGGRITFARGEWTVYELGSWPTKPMQAGVDLYADRYYMDELRMPVYDTAVPFGKKCVGYAHQFSASSVCGRSFTCATQAEADAALAAHRKSCRECISEAATDACRNSCCMSGILTTGAPCPTCRGSGVEV